MIHSQIFDAQKRPLVLKCFLPSAGAAGTAGTLQARYPSLALTPKRSSTVELLIGMAASGQMGDLHIDTRGFPRSR
jgi:hypothetical protein